MFLILENLFNKINAVFTPILGTPGILSEVSPIKAKKSIYSLG